MWNPGFGGNDPVGFYPGNEAGMDVQTNRYPLLKAYCYFDSAGNLGNWVLDGSGGLSAFATLAASPAFSPMPEQRRRAVRHP